MFKKFLFPAVLCLIIFSQPAISAAEFKTAPQKPEAGNTIRIIYNPHGTPLEGHKTIHAVFHLLVNNDISTGEKLLEKTEKGYTVEYTIPPETRAILVKFKAGEKVDLNNNHGYKVLMHDPKGNPVPGTKTAYARIIYDWGYYFGMDRDWDTLQRTVKTLEDEVKQHPEILSEHLGFYFRVLRKVKNREGQEIIAKTVESYKNRRALSEHELEVLYSYHKAEDNDSLAKRYLAELKKRFPECETLMNMEFETIFNQDTPESKMKKVAEVMKKFPGSHYWPYTHLSVLKSMMEERKEEAIEKYIRLYPEAGTYKFYMDFTIYQLRHGSIIKAEEYGKKAIVLAREYLEKPKLQKPSYLSESEWKEDRKKEYYESHGPLGIVYSELSKYPEAVSEYEKTLKSPDGMPENIHLPYVYALMQIDRNCDAVKHISELVIDYKSNERLNKFMEQAYLNGKCGKAGFASVMDSLKLEARSKLKQEVKKELVNYPAPDFTLQDPEGKAISLKDLRGRSVLLDFWATWCPPCRASFPTMKKVVEKYKDSNTRKIFFINTRDFDESRTTRVKNFLRTNLYPFDVLLDTPDSQTNDAFRISGIPCKIFIDKNGNVRYLHSGWSGNPEYEMEKIDLIFELIE